MNRKVLLTLLVVSMLVVSMLVVSMLVGGAAVVGLKLNCWRQSLELINPPGAELIGKCNEILKLDPADTGALRRRAQSYVVMGKLSEALSDLDRLVSIDPKYYTDRASFYAARLCRLDKAIQDYTLAIDRLPQSERDQIYERRGDCFFCLGQYRKALTDYSLAFGNYDKLSTESEALKNVDSNFAAESSNITAVSKIAATHYALANHEACVKFCTIALTSREDAGVDVRMMRADSYKGMGKKLQADRDYEAALQVCTADIRTNPKDNCAYFMRGRAYAAIGRLKDAQRDQERVTKLKLELGRDFCEPCYPKSPSLWSSI